MKDHPGRFLKLDFQSKTISEVPEIDEPRFYSVVAPSSQVWRIVEGIDTWEEFSLSFRASVSREPDESDTI